MNKQQLKKNRMDLEFHGEAQKANAFLILLTTGLLGFVGTFIWLSNTDSFYLGLALTLIFSLIGGFFYMKSSRRMNDILKEIESM